MMKVLAILLGLTGVTNLLHAQAPIVWSPPTIVPAPAGPTIGTNGWLGLIDNPIANCTWFYANRNPSGTTLSIYSNTMWCFNPSTGAAYRGWTSGTSGQTCTAGPGNGPPQDRHPIKNQWYDSRRHRMYMVGGVCNGAVPFGDIAEFWYTDLHTDSTLDTWTQITTANVPGGGNQVLRFGGTVYDPLIDVTFMFGYDGGAGSHSEYVWCPTDLNPTPGTLTLAQNGAGCAVADQWNELTGARATTGTKPPVGSGAPWSFPALVWDNCNSTALVFLSAGTNRTFAYNPATRVWSQKSSTGQPAQNTSASGMKGQPVAFVPPTCKAYYHYPGASTAHDYTYNYATDTWTDLGALGGETVTDSMSYDPRLNKLITYKVGDPPRMFVGTLPASFSQTVQVTAQEAIYPGSTTGIARTNEPITVGVPLAQSALACGSGNPASCTGTAVVGLAAGPAVGQFRCLGVWPDNSCKWLLVDTQIPSLTAGGTTTFTLQSGTGAFGGSNLATDNGSTITIPTGAATFTIKKANHNGFDIVDIGATHVVLTGASLGLVIRGPDPAGVYPANVTCLPTTGGSNCSAGTFLYTSANDSASTCSIEENGPARAAIKCTGSLKSSGGVAYLKFTVRYQFYNGKTYSKVSTILQNADLGNSNTFASAFKGHQGFELRIAANISGSLNYMFGNHTATPTTGTMSGSDEAHIYQGASNALKNSNWCGISGCVPFTNDQGYTISLNGSTLQSGTNNQFPVGYADISNGAGVGVEIGHYQMAGYEVKSLEFVGGGSDVRLGIWASQNSKPFYEPWPQWDMADTFVNFHATNPASLSNDFLKFQHYLIGRADYTYYNTTGVFPWQLISSASEDAFYINTQATANPNNIPAGSGCAIVGGPCVQDDGASNNNMIRRLWARRIWGWTGPGGDTQQEFRFSDMMQWITRGYGGTYLNAMHFYRMEASIAWPRADGFHWRDQPPYGAPGEKLDGFGHPEATSANSTLAFRNWYDTEHGHWWGISFAYFLTGDESLKDSIPDTLDWHLNPYTYQGANALYTSNVAAGLEDTRAVGVNLINSSRLAEYLNSIGDTTNATGVMNQATNMFNLQVKPDLCVKSGGTNYPIGCNFGPIEPSSAWLPSQGVSSVRGVRWGFPSDASGTWCGVTHNYRVAPPFMHGILIKGLLDFRNVKGSGWSDYQLSLDLIYGMSKWVFGEMFNDNGTGSFSTNGFRFYQAIDRANSCTGPGESPESEYAVQAQQTVWFNFAPLAIVDGSVAWTQKFKMAWQSLQKNVGISAADVGSTDATNLIRIINSPPGYSLNPLSFSLVDNGGGSYTLSWPIPSGAQSYRVKWGTKTIVDLIGYDPTAGAWIGDPTTTQNWFASTEATGVSCPSVCTITIATGQTGLTTGNFSVKAQVSGSGPSTDGGGAMGGTAKVGGTAKKR